MAEWEMRVRYIVLLIAIAFCVPGSFFSGGAPVPDDVCVFYGTITDSNGDPVEGAVVTVTNLMGSGENSTDSNETGYYLLNVSFEGFVMITIFEPAKLGFQTSTISSFGSGYRFDAVLQPLPAATEDVSGHVTFDDGGDAKGVTVVFEYNGPDGYYPYEDLTDIGGGYSFTVFPGYYEITMTYNGFELIYDGMELASGGGPYTYDAEIPRIPPIDSVLKGYITDGSTPVAGTLVVVSMFPTELSKNVMTDMSGYFEVPFFSGPTNVMVMLPDYAYMDRIDLPSGGEAWLNHSLVQMEYELHGAVTDDAGAPVEDVSIDYYSPHLSIYGTDPDPDGQYSIRVPAGTGFLMADPYDDAFGMYIQRIEDLSADAEVNIALEPQQPSMVTEDITFDGWGSFSLEAYEVDSRGSTVENRLMVDMFVGNYDLEVSPSEADSFWDLLDYEIESGPFGLDTTGNLLLDGLPFTASEPSFEMSGLVGALDDPAVTTISYSAEYDLNGTLIDDVHHTFAVNVSLDSKGYRTIVNIVLPPGWALYDYESENTTATPSGNRITLHPGMEDQMNDTYFDMVVMDIYGDELSLELDVPESMDEGAVCTMNWTVTDSFPANEYMVNVDFGDGNVTTDASGPLTHVYADDGTYEINVGLTDRTGRGAHRNATLQVRNLAPVVELSVTGIVNQTCDEGDVISFRVDASDVPADQLQVAWSMDGTFAAYSNFTSNSTYEYTVPDQGDYRLFASVIDGDGGSSALNISFSALNVDPVLDVDFVPPRTDGTVYELESVTVTVLSVTDVADDVSIGIEVTGGTDFNVQTIVEGSEYLVQINASGDYTIKVVADDGDGGIAESKFDLTVLRNGTIDHDGDGIPMNWEVDNGLSDSDPADAAKDKDGDGLTNLEEFQQGSDPNDEDSPKEQEEDGPDLTLLWIVIAVVVILLVLGIFIMMQRKNKADLEE